MRISAWKVLFVCLLGVSCSRASEMWVLSANHRPDPFGSVVAIDAAGAEWKQAVQLPAARGGYISFQLVVKSPDGCSQCRLDVRFPQPIEMYREWFHGNKPDGRYYPDALIPITLPYQFSLPDTENAVPHQTARAFWVDVWIGSNVKPRTYRGHAVLQQGDTRRTIPIAIQVLPAQIPAKDVIAVDSNSYAMSWLRQQYPKTTAGDGKDAEQASFRLVQQYYRIFYENRTTYHILGYGHAGYVDPGFAPELEGAGDQKHIVSWDKFDRLFGPVLDGQTFAGTRRGPQPISFMYLPINPDWPASYLWWGQPGYQAEFTNVVREMERHFREKGWTQTQFEVFFNQKKRYKGFPWDGDEIRFPRDNQNFFVYHALLQKSLPADTPVHFIMRVDSSWTMPEQMQKLRNVIGLWCASGGMYVWAADQLPALKQRGDTVWIYGGTPSVQESSSAIAEDPLRAWIFGVDGFVRWLAVDPEPDPWHILSDGGTETLVYPGERFGIAGPIPSIRLKLQRNAVQDLDLLDAEARRGSREVLQAQVTQLFDHTQPAQWRHSPQPPPPGKPMDWTNTDIDDALKPYSAQFGKPDPDAWQRVHNLALEQSRILSSGGAQ